MEGPGAGQGGSLISLPAVPFEYYIPDGRLFSTAFSEGKPHFRSLVILKTRHAGFTPLTLPLSPERGERGLRAAPFSSFCWRPAGGGMAVYPDEKE